MNDSALPTIRIIAQVGDQPVQVLGTVTAAPGDDGPATLRKTAELLRTCAHHFDQMTGAYEVLVDLAEIVE